MILRNTGSGQMSVGLFNRRFNADNPDYVGLRGSFGQQHCNPRTLRSHQIGKMVSLEGIVTRCKLYPLHIFRSGLMERLLGPTQNAQINPLLRCYPEIPLESIPRRHHHRPFLDNDWIHNSHSAR